MRHVYSAGYHSPSEFPIRRGFTCRIWISSDTVDRLERLKADTIYVRSHHLSVVLRNYTEFLDHRGNIKRLEFKGNCEFNRRCCHVLS